MDWIELVSFLLLPFSNNQYSISTRIFAGFGKERLDVPVYSSLCVCVLCVIAPITAFPSSCCFPLFLGPKVVSKVITTQTIEALTKVLKRRPVIWDNIHANDYDQRRVFLGPYDGRPVELYPKLNGVLTNPNCEFESNFIAVHTLASWLRDASLVTVEEPMSIDPKSSSSAEPMEEDMLASGESHGKDTTDGKTDQEASQDISASESSDSEAVKVEGEMDTESGTSLSECKGATARIPYDPQNALREAVSAWLEEFSKVKNASSRTYAKSGAYTVAPEAVPVSVQAPMATCIRSTKSAATPVCSPVVTTPSPIKVAKENSRKKLSSSSSPGTLNREYSHYFVIVRAFKNYYKEGEQLFLVSVNSLPW